MTTEKTTTMTDSLTDYLPTVERVAKRWGATVKLIRYLGVPNRIEVACGDDDVEVEFNAAGELAVDGETGDLETNLELALEIATEAAAERDHWYEDDERELAEMDF